MGVIGGKPVRAGSAKEQQAKWLWDGIKPDVAVTFTLPIAISSDNGKAKHWVRGDPIRYANAWDQFVRRLSKRCWKKSYLRHKRLIPNGATIEGDGEVIRYHLHGFFRRPPNMTFDKFKAAIEWEWMRSAWSMTDVDIQPITGRWVGYTGKDGPEALLTGSLSF